MSVMSVKVKDALDRYAAELVRLYPPATGHYRVEPWGGHEQTYLVSITPPQDEDAWININEAMSEVATGR